MAVPSSSLSSRPAREQNAEVPDLSAVSFPYAEVTGAEGSEIAQRRAQILFGEAHMELWNLCDAFRAFWEAGHKPGLVACGEKALADGHTFFALRAFAEAEHKPGLITCGKKALAEGYIYEAVTAFKAAEHKPGLVTCGEKALAKDDFIIAFLAFGAASHRAGLIACGEKAILDDRQDFQNFADRAFQAAYALESSDAESA